jgi:hypothetical protein
MFMGSGYMGFSHRWLVSLTSGGDIQERACKLPDLKEQRVTEQEQSGFYPSVYSLRRNHAH